MEGHCGSCSRKIRLPERSVKILAPISSALQYLHSNGVLYCDLKPSNVLLNEYGVLKLSDFALARRLDGKRDDSGEEGSEEDGGKKDTKRGTPCYMAPELFTSRGVFSVASTFGVLGCTLYELTFGHPPSFTTISQSSCR